VADPNGASGSGAGTPVAPLLGTYAAQTCP
jgi:hypothetical protein